MSWTGRSEAIPCCEGPLGQVQSTEEVARLLHSRNMEAHLDPFSRSEMFGEKGRSNACGEADGGSVVRCSNLHDDELRRRSTELAAANSKTPRTAEGARVATASNLRAVRVDERPDEQVVFIYDDPKPKDDYHAVVRGKETLDRPEQGLVLQKARAAFARRVEQSEAA